MYPFNTMDKTEFFKLFTPHDHSYLYEDMIDSTDGVYTNVVPRQTGTTTSLIVYSVYKIMEKQNNYQICYRTPGTTMMSFMYLEFDSYLSHFCSEFNNINNSNIYYESTKNGKFNLILNNTVLGTIYLIPLSQEIRGYRFDEILYEDPLLNKKTDIHHLMNHEVYTNNTKVKIIHTSWSITTRSADISVYIPKYSPIFLFSHINLLDYQEHMLNTLGKELYIQDCLMKGKYYARRI